MWQDLAVGIIVALAGLYVGAKYLPESWRRALVHRLSQGGRRSKLVQWLDTSASCGSGCGSCGSCGDTAEPAPPAGKGKVIKIHQQR
ncbi:MAG: DUF6587 family protein [Telluria sp.]